MKLNNLTNLPADGGHLYEHHITIFIINNDVNTRGILTVINTSSTPFTKTNLHTLGNNVRRSINGGIYINSTSKLQILNDFAVYDTTKIHLYSQNETTNESRYEINISSINSITDDVTQIL